MNCEEYLKNKIEEEVALREGQMPLVTDVFDAMRRYFSHAATAVTVIEETHEESVTILGDDEDPVSDPSVYIHLKHKDGGDMYFDVARRVDSVSGKVGYQLYERWPSKEGGDYGVEGILEWVPEDEIDSLKKNILNRATRYTITGSTEP